MIFDKLFKNSKGEYVNVMDILLEKNELENYIYTLADAHAIDLIAKTIAKCEIQTFELKNKKIEETKSDLYWTLNLQPNYNENGTSFMYKLATKLLIDGTALVLINETTKTNLLYVADEYNASDDILYGKTFDNISILDAEGNSFPVEKTYNQNNSIYYSLKNTNLTKASENFKTNSTKILKTVQNKFIKANAEKWKLKFPGSQPTMLDPQTKKPIDYNEYKEKLTEGLFNEDEAVVLLSETFDLINLNQEGKEKSLSDFEIIVDKISNAVAQKWNIPLDIFKGNKTEKSTGNSDFITFAVDVYFELIEDGLNIGLVGKKDYLKGEYVKFNRTNITHKDVLDCGTGIDKLTANRFSRNEINKLLKLPEIDEDWANEHNITKNYGKAEGGAKDDGE